MRSVNLLIKPASSLCNMRCKYCFYHDVAENREIESYGIMSEETAKTLIDRAFEYADSITFAFQGGEPTLAGEDYYRAFHSAVEKYNTKKIPTVFSLQTNGYNISEGLLDIFSK